VIKIRLLICFRAYCKQEEDKVLQFQVAEAKKHFPDAKIIVAVCGKKPVVDAKIIHYSEKPIGLTKPWEIAIEQAKDFDNLIMVDGDDQFIFEEIKKFYALCEGTTAIPKRQSRILYISDSKIDRITLEDLENAYIRTRYNTPLIDLQPGLYLLNKEAIQSLDFKDLDHWVGDLSFLDQLHKNDIQINQKDILVRNQELGTLNLEILFKRIKAFEKYFNLSFFDLISQVEKDPNKFLIEGSLSKIEPIKLAYQENKNKLKIKDMKGLILAGGFGKRLRPITHTIQKQLIPIANKPIIVYIIEDLVNSGINKIGIVVGPNKEQIQSELGDGSKFGAEIDYIIQDNPGGLAHAVLVSKDFLQDDDFIMYLGDNLFSQNIKNFVETFNNSKAEAKILLTRVNDPQRFGIAVLNGSKVTQVLEKPENPPSDLAITGVYAFRKSIWEAISKIQPSARGELEITDAIQWLINHNKQVDSEVIEGWWEDTGKPSALLVANQLILDHKLIEKNEAQVEDNVNIQGRVSIGKNTIIKQGTTIRGPLIIGDNCEIGPNAYIGPYTAIGNNVKIKQTQIEHSIILENTEININKRIIDAVIGKNSKINSINSTLGGHCLIIADDSEVEL